MPEVTEIAFDPAKIFMYDKLLNIFWQAHDPTTLNRQERGRRHVLSFHHFVSQ